MERQGLLVGHGLNSAQVSAIYYREVETQAEQQDRDKQQFKYALLTSRTYEFDVLFPELMPTETDDNQLIESPEDDETIIYKFSEQPELTQEEMERELAMLMMGGEMHVGGGEIDGQA